MTTVALSMMPEVIKSMAEMNLSIPLTRDNLNTYTQEMLTRSYAASWTVITDVIGSSFASPWAQLPYASGSLQTPAKIAVPNILAAVALWRVVLWYSLPARSNLLRDSIHRAADDEQEGTGSAAGAGMVPSRHA